MGEERKVPKADVKKIVTAARYEDPITDGLWKGLAIGGLSGFFTGLAFHGSGDDYWAISKGGFGLAIGLIGAGVGAGVGLGLDKARDARQELFRAPRE